MDISTVTKLQVSNITPLLLQANTLELKPFDFVEFPFEPTAKILVQHPSSGCGIAAIPVAALPPILVIDPIFVRKRLPTTIIGRVPPSLVLEVKNQTAMFVDAYQIEFAVSGGENSP